MVGDAVEGMPWLGTFHSIAAKMLRRHAELVGLQSNFTILDTDDQLRRGQEADPGRRARREALALAPARRAIIDKWKNQAGSSPPISMPRTRKS